MEILVVYCGGEYKREVPFYLEVPKTPHRLGYIFDGGEG